MRILVLIDLEAADDCDPQFKGPKTQETAAVEWHVVSALRQLGHDVGVLPLEEQRARAVRSLKNADADLVFNLTEHVAGDRCKDAYVASLLEHFCLPYTGAGPSGLALCRDKARSKRLLRHRMPPSFTSQFSRSWALRLRAEVRAEYYSPNPEMWLHWPDFLGLTQRSGEYPAARLAMTHEGRHD
jgi:hypothetical protein